jgi:polyisoprenoid-binding protein YceI
MSRLKCCFAVVVVIFLGVLHSQAGQKYTFDQNQSTIGFEVHHLLGMARGQFHQFSGTIDLDRDQPERSSVSARIQVASIDTGIHQRDEHLRSGAFFDAGKFPVITFQSASVNKTGERAGDVNGEFTMHGVKRPIVLHVQLLDGGPNDETRWKVTTARLRRKDFGLLFGGTAEAISGIGQDVAVNIEIVARPGR